MAKIGTMKRNEHGTIRGAIRTRRFCLDPFWIEKTPSAQNDYVVMTFDDWEKPIEVGQGKDRVSQSTGEARIDIWFTDMFTPREIKNGWTMVKSSGQDTYDIFWMEKDDTPQSGGSQSPNSGSAAGAGDPPPNTGQGMHA